MPPRKSFSQRIIDVLQKHPVIVLFGMLLTISGGIYKYLDTLYDREFAFRKQQLEEKTNQKIQELENERSEVKIAIGSASQTINVSELFADAAQLPPSYTVLNGNHFAVAKISDETGMWQWHLKSEFELLQESFGAKIEDILPQKQSEELTALLNSKDIGVYEAPNSVSVTIGDMAVEIRPHATFRFMSYAYLEKVAEATEAQQSESTDETFTNLLAGIKTIGGDGLAFYENILTIDPQKAKSILEKAGNESIHKSILQNLAEADRGRTETFLFWIKSNVSPDIAKDLRTEMEPLREKKERERKEENEKQATEKRQREAERKKEREQNTKIDPLAIFLTYFIQFGTSPKGMGAFHATDYSFRKDMFCVQGYFEFADASTTKKVRVQLISLGVMSNEGMHFMEFRVPVERDFKDVQRLMTLIKTARILN